MIVSIYPDYDYPKDKVDSFEKGEVYGLETIPREGEFVWYMDCLYTVVRVYHNMPDNIKHAIMVIPTP